MCLLPGRRVQTQVWHGVQMHYCVQRCQTANGIQCGFICSFRCCSVNGGCRTRSLRYQGRMDQWHWRLLQGLRSERNRMAGWRGVCHCWIGLCAWIYFMCLMEIKHGFFRAEEYYLLVESGVEKESWPAPCSGECSFKLIGRGEG
jgi:hypothetical protein